MATPNFLEYAKSAPPPLTGLTSGLTSGLQSGMELAKIREAARTAQQQRELAAQFAPLQQELVKSQIEQNLAKSTLGGMQSLTGPAGEAQSIIALRNRYPEGSPERTMLEKVINTKQNLDEARTVLYGSPLRYSPDTTKQQMILDIQQQYGVSPEDAVKIINGQEPLPDIEPEKLLKHPITNIYEKTPEEKKQIENDIAVSKQNLLKKIGDPTTRNAMAKTIDLAATMNSVDINSIAKFASVEGQLRYKAEEAKNALGRPVSDDFIKARQFYKVQLPLMTDALRQAFQTSQRWSYVNHLITPMLNPITWTDSPTTAINNFNHIRDKINHRLKLFQTMSTGGLPMDINSLENMLEMDLTSPTTGKKPTISESDIEYTAKKHGVSVEDVKSRLIEEGRL